VVSLCAAQKLGIQHRIPSPRPVRRTVDVSLVLLLIEYRSSVLLCSELPAAYIPGPWGLPARAMRAGELPEKVARLLARKTRLAVHSLRKVATLRHAITHRRIAAHVFRVHLEGAPPALPGSKYCWAAQADVGSRLTSSLFRKALQADGGSRHGHASSRIDGDKEILGPFFIAW